MPSKASKLKTGVNKTSRGLFQGMQPLSGAQEEQKVEEVKAEDKTSEVVKEEPKKEEVVEQVSTTEEVITDVDVKEEDIQENTVKEEIVEEKEEESEIKPVENNNSYTNNNVISTPEQNISEETVVNNSQIIAEEKVQTQIQNDVMQQMPTIHQQPVMNPNLQYVQPVQQEIQYQQPMNEQMMQPQYQQYMQQIPNQQYQQRPVYTQQIAEPMRMEQQIYRNESSNMYNQNVVMPKQTMPEYKEKKTPSKDASKKDSRYEKDKFLLLDIRGYRDYVEHMAKAANMSATKYIRNLIEQDMRINMDIYQAHKELEERLRERR
ncbi:hypothetical protein [Butyrivibrio sp. YAB3001]|uniref:hypothetical protein n=1 Tax=Butyrivibrio sp. YAB3001 TaxID=1520812 RepID=UPI0008F6498E|nr:hypothetical protein [Butyrivibrio sp. YAB3001]SFC86478.1 hypothetical protein SAMN02910398_03344 [Butyrivibrio sp. YAB3001]